MTLGDVLAEATVDLSGTETTASEDGALTWSRAGRPFATASADGAEAEFGLDTAVAEAASRTPDAVPCDRGPGWIRFSPSALDAPAIDRAVAWLASAYRRAEPRN